MSQQPDRDHYRMAVYVISVAAELAGMHPQTLRNYERVGLLRPARTQGGNRRYSQADIAVLHRIAQLVDSGMNIEGIRHVLMLENEVAQLRKEVDVLREHLAQQRVSRGELVPTRQVLSVFTRRSGFLGEQS
jgi:MerR family transcriptional regulator/heat shock protein HspR